MYIVEVCQPEQVAVPEMHLSLVFTVVLEIRGLSFDGCFRIAVSKQEMKGLVIPAGSFKAIGDGIDHAVMDLGYQIHFLQLDVARIIPEIMMGCCNHRVLGTDRYETR